MEENELGKIVASIEEVSSKIDKLTVQQGELNNYLKMEMMNSISENDNKRYKVKNKFLRAIMGNYSKLELDLNIDYHIFGLTHGKGVGSAILTYLVRIAFNIHRFPYYEDRHFASYDGIRYGDGEITLENISNCDEFLQNIDEMIDELKVIYNITQKKLDEMYPNQNFVELIHNVDGGYAATILQLKNNALKASQEYIKIETDTIDCFTNNSGKYSKDVCYKMNIKKNDILYFDKVFESTGKVLIEHYEYIVMNKDMLGLREIPVSGITMTKSNFNESSYMTYPILNRTKYCHIRSSANRFVCFDEPQINPSFGKEPGLLCRIIKTFCKDF